MAGFGQKSKKINELSDQVEQLQRQLNDLWSQNNTLHQHNEQLTKHVTDARLFLDSHGGEEVWRSGEAVENAKKLGAQLEADVAQLKAEKLELSEALEPLRVDLHLQDLALTDFEHPAYDSVALRVELETLRKGITEKVRTLKAVKSASSIEVPTTKAGSAKAVKDYAKLALRAFNTDVQNIITSATANNYDASVTKIIKAADAIEKLGTAAGVKIDPNYVSDRLRELKLAVEHLEIRKIERELERERKAELREQARAEQELAAEKAKLEKERQHYLNVIETLRARGDEVEVLRLEQQLEDVAKAIEDVDYRAANIQAGYVYVISNLGTMGERMVKIGMTRRLDPMDRVRELGDASVPFPFDVHALFFADNAASIETMLHRKFADRRVNRINNRREFFYCTPEEVLEALKEEGVALVEYTLEPEAEQYRLSLRETENPA